VITEAEIIEQISQSIEERIQTTPDADPYSFTSRELVKVTGISKEKIRSLLRSMIESGDVEVTRVMKKNISGSYAPTPAYKFLAQGASKEAGENK